MTSKVIRRALAGLLALAIALLPITGLAQSKAVYFWWQMVNEDGLPFTEEGRISCSVYEVNGLEKKYHTSAGLSGAPYVVPLGSDTNGRLHFYTATSDPVNVKCYDKYGGYAYKNKVTPYTHRIMLDTTTPNKVSRFAYSGDTSAGLPVAAGISRPQGALITGVMVDRRTPMLHPAAKLASIHINVGFAGSHAVSVNNALVSALDTGYAGAVMAHRVAGTQNGSVALASHIGMALRHAALDAPWPGVRPYLIHLAGGLDVVYTVGDLGNYAGQGGHVYIFWQQTHVGLDRQPQR